MGHLVIKTSRNAKFIIKGGMTVEVHLLPNNAGDHQKSNSNVVETL